MDIRERILGEFKSLIAEARQIREAGGFNDRTGQWLHWPTVTDALRILTRAQNLVRRACSEQSDHYKSLLRLPGQSPHPAEIISESLGILEAASTDFERGLLFDLKEIIRAEALGDFMEQAEALLSAGYHVPAASLVGAVLEDGLRGLSDAKGISYPPRTKIDSLNSELAKAGVYDKLIQKRITALADIRNNADHGHPDKFKPEDVDDMVKWTRRFLADYLR